MSDLYTTRTANLRATNADFGKIDSKRIDLNGKNILDYISNSEFNSYDTRDPQLKNDELDIWNTEISLSEEGHIEVKPHVHGIAKIEYDSSKGEYIYTFEGMTENQHNTLKTAVKVIDNEVLGTNNEHIMYWQTDGLTNDKRMFNNCTNLTTFTSDLSSLTDVYYMFDGCTNLTTFSSDLSSLTNGAEMFNNCRNLTSFNSDLPSLTNGNYMFYNCRNLTTFSSDLPSLTNGESMFYNCNNLNSFTSDLPSLTNGKGMFYNCNQLNSFPSDLHSLTDGSGMFSGCSNLTAFTSDLSSLTKGTEMFGSCKLDAQSVANIIHILPQRDYMPNDSDNGEIHEGIGCLTIGLGCYDTMEDITTFIQECDCDTIEEFLEEFSSKNWLVEFQCNGRPTEATTYNMRRGETLPIYTKLIEVIMPTDENERKPHYQYTSVDGSKFYNINYFHSTNGSTEGYNVFSSLEEAINSYNVTPKN